MNISLDDNVSSESKKTIGIQVGATTLKSQNKYTQCEEQSKRELKSSYQSNVNRNPENHLITTSW